MAYVNVFAEIFKPFLIWGASKLSSNVYIFVLEIWEIRVYTYRNSVKEQIADYSGYLSAIR